jgi:hypothetical protein
VTAAAERLRLHLAFLAAALRGDRRAHPADDLFAFARRHKVGAILDHLLEGSPLADALPAGARDGFRALRRAQGDRNGLLLAALARIDAAFGNAGVPWTLLKGLGLAQRYYGGLDRRTTRDLDLLVVPKDLPAAEGALRGLGFRRASWAPSRRLALRFVHGFEYTAPDVTGDLHWALARHPSYRFDEGGLRGRRQEVALGPVRAHVPGDEDALAFAAVSALKDLQRGSLRARALVDLHRIAGAVDPAAFLEGRRAEGTYAIALNMLALMLHALDARDSLPAVAAAVDRARADVRVDEDAHLHLLEPPRLALRNRFLALELYDCSPARSLLWWLLSMPVRLLAYRSWRPARRGRPPR